MKLSCKRNFIENFLAFPNKQRYCPNLYKSKAKYGLNYLQNMAKVYL